MPRVVDAHAQRVVIARALWRLAAAAGMEAVSLRDVAAEAGVSMGRVQHYFATKDEMLLFAWKLAHQRMQQRIDARIPAGADAEQTVRAILQELLGEDPETREVLLVHLAYSARALSDSRIGAMLTAGDDEIRSLIASAVRTGDPEREAQLLLLTAERLGTDVALGQRRPDEARELLEYAMTRVFGR